MPAFSSLDLIQSHRWSRLFFTTYALSLSFFEAVVLDRILRQQIGSCTLLADVSGVRAAMEEIGANSVGKQYDLEPVAVRDGCFHPKLLAMLSRDEAMLLIGSGNLTFGGWGSNLECIEYLHPSFAPDAFQDTADFLETLATVEHVKHAAQRECARVAEELRAKVKGLNSKGQIRVLHSLNRSLLDQIAEMAAELGGATRVVAVSPFFDNTGLPEICKRLNLDRAHVHSHDGGTVEGFAGSNWPGGPTYRFRAVRLNQLSEEKPRLLHAKMFEICCRHGRILISGSANATAAALGIRRNVELCVARIDKSSSRWQFNQSEPPQPTALKAEDLASPDEQDSVAVLTASLEGTRMTGRVISSFPAGQVTAYRRAGLSWIQIGKASVNSSGSFQVDISSGWQTFQNNQPLVQLRHLSGAKAQGFVALPDLREISRRLGSSAPQFFSFLQGKETPADVAAILDYILQNPDWLPKSENPGQTSSADNRDKYTDAPVDVDELLNGPRVPGGNRGAHEEDWQAWRSFMQDVYAIFRQPGGPLESSRKSVEMRDPEDGDSGQNGSTEEDDRRTAEVAKALGSFDKLLVRMLSTPREARPLDKAAAIAQYVCSRLELESLQVLQYLGRLLDAFEDRMQGDRESQVFSAVAIVWAAQLPGSIQGNAVQLRRLLLRAGLTNLPPDPPDLSDLDGFRQRLAKSFDFEGFWKAALSSRTAQEEVRSFWANTRPLTAEEFPFLSQVPEWTTLRDGPSPRIHRLTTFMNYCPATHVGLPLAQAERLQQQAAATCACGRVSLCEEI